MAFRLLDQRPVYFNLQGQINAGGSLLTFNAGTSTPATTYADQGLTVPNGVSVALDGTGRTVNEVWSAGNLRVVVLDVNGGVVTDSDNAAANSGIPDQTGNSGDVLSTNGTAMAWIPIAQVPSILGQAGKVLTTDGSTYFWGAAGNAISGGTVTNSVLLNVRSTVQTLASAATLNVDIRLGDIIVLNQATDCVITIIGQPAAGQGMPFTIIRFKDATGTARALTIATAKWPAGIAVPVTQTTGAIDAISCLAFDGRAFVLGSYNTALA